MDHGTVQRCRPHIGGPCPLGLPSAALAAKRAASSSAYALGCLACLDGSGRTRLPSGIEPLAAEVREAAVEQRRDLGLTDAYERGGSIARRMIITTLSSRSLQHSHPVQDLTGYERATESSHNFRAGHGLPRGV